jgi:N-acetylmuramoyl-L-alanine amidase
VIDVYGRRAPVAPAPGGALPPALRPVRTVVVDPGHGGLDPGAIGVGGLREKEITLRVARALGKRLAEQGFRVVHTREGDRTLSLEERTAIAESVDGDVFVSIHANAAPRRSVHGIETYYLDENHERHALNLAARENGIPHGEVNVLQRTLAKLHIEEVSPRSRRLAALVQDQVVRGLPQGSRPNDLGVKKGPFYVLFLSNMPAILVEAGFLTNRGEARRLRDVDYLDDLAGQITLGLTRYRDASATVALGGAR